MLGSGFNDVDKVLVTAAFFTGEVLPQHFLHLINRSFHLNNRAFVHDSTHFLNGYCLIQDTFRRSLLGGHGQRLALTRPQLI